MVILSIWSTSQPFIVILSTSQVYLFTVNFSRYTPWSLFHIKLPQDTVGESVGQRIIDKISEEIALRCSQSNIYSSTFHQHHFFPKVLNKLTHIWFEAIVENLSTVPTRGSAAPRYLKHHCKNITIVQISFCEWIKLAVKLHLRKCSPISSPSHPILANPSLNPSPPHLSQISSSHFSALSNIVEFHWILSQLWTLPQIYFD